MDRITTVNQNNIANLFKPSEIIGILRNHLATGQVNQRVVCLRGIYFKGGYINQYYRTATDRLVDESTSDELTLSMPLNLRDDLENGNVITVHGILDRSITNKGLIQIVLKVTEVEKLKELAVSEDEIKRTELRRIKSEKGFKNVDSLLESLLYQDKRPQIALVYAETSITNDDFEKGVQAARTHIDFKEYRVSFAKTKAFCQTLKQLDGGGAGLEALDEVELLETLVNMNTAWMYGAGHEGEKLFILNIADKAIAIPHALGTYFRDITDGVVQKRNNSRAALVKEVEGQFKKQLEESNKKNKELLAQIEKMTKQQQEQTKVNKENIEKLTEQQKKNLEAQQKKNDETLAKFQAQSKQQMEQSQKQNAALQKQLAELSKSQKESVDKLTEQNKQTNTLLEKERQHSRELERQLTAKPNYMSTFIIIAIIAAIIGFIIAQFFK